MPGTVRVRCLKGEQEFDSVFIQIDMCLLCAGHCADLPYPRESAPDGQVSMLEAQAALGGEAALLTEQPSDSWFGSQYLDIRRAGRRLPPLEIHVFCWKPKSHLLRQGLVSLVSNMQFPTLNPDKIWCLVPWTP